VLHSKVSLNSWTSPLHAQSPGTSSGLCTFRVFSNIKPLNSFFVLFFVYLSMSFHTEKCFNAIEQYYIMTYENVIAVSKLWK
jgi:hypothetical protein